MAKTKLIRRAKVVLTGAKSYKLAGKTFKQNVSEIVKGNDVEEFINNGYFRCRELEPVEKKVKKKKKKSSDDDSSSKKKKSGSKKKTKKSSKKKVKKKVKK